MNDVNGSASMPPKTGIAIARATSAPRPVAINTGTRRGQGRYRRHHAGSNAFQPGFVNGVAYFLNRRDLSLLQQLMDVSRHHDAIVDSEAEQRDETNPHRCVEFHAPSTQPGPCRPQTPPECR